jgi:hypothetical protein
MGSAVYGWKLVETKNVGGRTVMGIGREVVKVFIMYSRNGKESVLKSPSEGNRKTSSPRNAIKTIAATR